MGAITLTIVRRWLLVGLLTLSALVAWPARAQWPDEWAPIQPVQGLDLPMVRALHAGERYLWVGTVGGLYRYDGHAAVLWHEDQINALLTGADGGLWVAGGRGLFWLSDGDAAPQAVFTDTQATCLLQPDADTLWVGTPQGARRIVPQTRQQVAELLIHPTGRAPLVRALAQDSSGALWLGTFLEGLWRYDPITGGVAPALPGAEETGIVNALLVDDKGRLWVAANEGLFDRQGLRPLPAAGSVRTLFQDVDGELWAGTDAGLIRLSDGALFTSEHGLPGNAVLALARDPWEGGLWIGTDEGVGRFEGRFWRTYTPADGLPHPLVRAIAPDGAGGMWLSTGSGTVCRWQGDRCETVTALQGITARALWWDAEDAVLWIAARDGLYRYRDRQVERVAERQELLTVARDNAGRLWASDLADLYDGDLQPVTPQGYWSEIAQVNTLHADGRGHLWLGTEDGLLRCTEALSPTCEPPYLPGRDVRAIADDGAGNFWLATDAGVYLYLGDVDAASPVPAFARADGLPADPVYSLYRTADGSLWFGTEGGLTRYTPAQQSPRLTVAGGAAQVTRRYDQLDDPFQLTGEDWRANPDRLLFTYVLEQKGRIIEQGVTASPSLRLAQLHYRHLWGVNPYRLRVRAVSRDLRFSEDAILAITVPPRKLWQEAWFAPGAGLTVGGLALALLGVREARRRRGRFAYRYDLLIRAQQAQPDSLTYGITAELQRAGLRGRFQRPVPITHQMRLDPALGDRLPPSPDALERLVWDARPALGRALCASLFPQPLLRQLESVAAAPRYGLRLRLCFDQAPGLAALPWELIDAGEPLGLLGQREDTALVRYVEPRQPLRRQWIGRELRVLAVLAHGRDVPPLDLAAEKARLVEILDGLERVRLGFVAGFHAAELLGETPVARDLRDLLAERLREADGWDVVHFVGHAGPDPSPPAGEAPQVVLWGEDADGLYRPISLPWLDTLLSGLPAEDRPKLFVLNACQTVHMGSELVQTLLDRGVGAVAGMQWPVLDDVARAFAEGFYNTLKGHGQVDRAVSVARNQMVQVAPDQPDWSAPVLVMQTADGFIFK